MKKISFMVIGGLLAYSLLKSKSPKRNPKKGCYTHVKIKKSTNKDKKLMAIFTGPGCKKTTHFGASGYEDYTIHKDSERKRRYIKRHEARENWNDPTTAGALSRWILWNKKSYSASVKDFLGKFNLSEGYH